ncbi:MAG TPA: hypothetical protein VG937_24070 [Polyangiaceae bacterium]|nr:hypothetical protein [Polyangiaceae bacterium]
MLQEEKFLGIAELDSVRLRAYLTTVGWARVDALARGGIRSKRAFVAMAFNPEMKKAYNEGIEPALLECGYEPPFLVDDPVHEERASEPDYQRKIDDRIFAEIRRSRFVIADATFRKVNVFLEAGFAEGLGLDVFWCCRSDQIEELAFDTRQIGHIVWTTSEDLRLAIVDRLGRRGLRLA